MQAAEVWAEETVEAVVEEEWVVDVVEDRWAELEGEDRQVAEGEVEWVDAGGCSSNLKWARDDVNACNQPPASRVRQ